MTFKYRYRKQIILIGIITILLGIVIGFIFYKTNNKKEKKEVVELEKEDIREMKKEEKEEENYQVDIKGQIQSPGIYSLPINSRVKDVIEKAGGLTDLADTSVINLSKKITDEMVIIIYSKDEVNDFKKTKEIEKQVEERCIEKDENSLRNDACIIHNNETSNKVNINTATKEELMTLSGIGESKAKDIISFREKNGLFTSIEDIKKISGIGDNLFAQIKEDITI